MIVSKFGGSTTTSIKSIHNVKVLAQNKARQIFVFSAVGKVYPEKYKLTDLLIKFFDSEDVYCKEKFFQCIKNKLTWLKNVTHVKIRLGVYLNQIKKSTNKNFVVSRGEFITSLIMSRFLNLPFVPAEKLILFSNNELNQSLTQAKIKAALKKYGRFCTSGFYGFNLQTHEIELFERGGGDYSGAILAKLGGAKIYENFTDVSGVKSACPEIVKTPKTIKKLSYQSMAKFGEFGSGVFQAQASKYLCGSRVKTVVKNIFDLKGDKTILFNGRDRAEFVGFRVDGRAKILVKTNNRKFLKKHKLAKNKTGCYFFRPTTKTYKNYINQFYNELFSKRS